MILSKIYTEPFPIFEPVKFRNGINFIYGKKEVKNPKNSLNSIGKSTFLDLIDFCLLASFNKTHNPRLFSATKLIGELTIVLEFKIGEIQYIIKRGFENPNSVEFGTIGNIETYQLKELKILLGNLIFRQEEYDGKFYSSWYRGLISFFLKVQKFKKEQFVDPVKYIKEVSEVEINLFHLFLLNINNELAYNVFKYRDDQKRLKPSIKEIKRFVNEKYGLNDIKETQSEINKLKLEIKKLQKAVETFKLGEQYEDAEVEANQLTANIKEFLYENHRDRAKVESYKNSFSLPENISLRRITNIYKQVSEELAVQVKASLKEAIEFRKNLSESRKDFIGQEIEKLERFISERELKIQEFEEKRAKLFYFLSTKEAINDLTEAFYNLSEKQNNLNELEGNSRILIDLTSELAEIETELNKTSLEIIKFLEHISDSITDFYEIVSTIFEKIYITKGESSSFSITPNSKKNSLLEIDLTTPDMFGKGKNQGRTLIYDLSVLIQNINQNRNMPRFLVHDGIFDGVDKAHFLAVWEFVENMAQKGKQFQYITTINEEGTLSEKFGNKDLITPNKIEENSILILTPNDKLFGSDF